MIDRLRRLAFWRDRKPGDSYTLPGWTVPLALLVVLVFGFGLLIPWLGFFWDDWPVLLTQHLGGAEGFWNFYQYDRPYSAWTYIVTMPILGTSPLPWHIFTLLLRWGTALALWWALAGLWPNARRDVTWTALIFAIHPVFTQQSISVAYSQHWICYLLYAISLGAMVAAWRKPRLFLPLTALALVTAAVQLLTMEYFAGLELLRPVFLWILASEHTSSEEALSFRRRLGVVLRRWLPYLLVLAGFFIWRLFLLEIPGGDENYPVLLQRLFTDPLDVMPRLALIAIQDIDHLLLSVWANTFNPLSLDFIDRFVLVSWLLAAIVAFGVGDYMTRLRFAAPSAAGGVDSSPDHWRLQAALVGSFAIIAGMLTVWLTDRQIIAGAYSSRFGLAAMLGASLLVVSGVRWLIAGRGKQVVLLSLMIGLAAGGHLRTANDFRWGWVKQTRFYWQLSWRAPAIEPHTAIVSDGEIFPFVGLYSHAAGINLLYPRQLESDQELPYWFYSLGREFVHQMPNYLDGMLLETAMRHYAFYGNTRHTLAIHYDPGLNNCLHVLAPDDANVPDVPEVTALALRNSDLSRILVDAKAAGYPPTEIFGPEPERGWCYLYQKAELARQQQDWTAVLDLAEQAAEEGFSLNNSSSNTPFEWLPFVDSYRALGQFEQARQLSLEIAQRDTRMTPRLCTLWGVDPRQEAVDIWRELGCENLPN